MHDFMMQIENGQILLNINTKLYSTIALFRTCYLFTDRCYLYLCPGAGEDIEVYIKPKAEQYDPKGLAGDFCNELIDQQVRQDLVQETGEIRKLIVAQAFAEGNLLDEVKEHGSYQQDPLQISKR